MGSEEIETQCAQPQPIPSSTPCESTASVGIASVPLLAHTIQMSATPSQATTPTSASTSGLLPPSALTNGASQTPPQNVTVQPSVPTVQVIQQPLQSPAYLQNLYAPQQQHMFLPGNLTIQPTLQSLSGAPGLSLQLQGKAIDNKGGGPAIISASPMQPAGNFSAANLMPAGGQMITAGTKTCVQGQMLTASTKSTAVIQGQSGFIPSTTANQTVVIGQLGVLSNQPSVLPHQAKALPDSQKSKSFLISQPAALHPKSPILPSPNVSCGTAGQMIANNQLKQLPSAPHIISSQAPTMIASQAQILGSLQALGASLPQGITWATPAPLHSQAMLSQNPIFIRSQQSDMFIQSPPPQATLHAVPVATAATAATAVATAAPAQQPPSATIAQVQKVKQVRPASSVATQTTVSTSTSTNSQVSLTKAQVATHPMDFLTTFQQDIVLFAYCITLSDQQGKQRTRTQTSHSSPVLCTAPTVTQTATTQTQTPSPSSLKADAANQTKPTNDIKIPSPIPTFHNKSSATETTFPSNEPKVEKEVETQEIEQPMDVPCPEILPSTTDIAVVAPSIVKPQEEQMDTSELVVETFDDDVTEEKTSDLELDPVEVVVPKPDIIVKEKQPQKAIVKPHVLTHVIEGFVIQEGSEPFPVSRSSQNNSSPPPKSPSPEKPIDDVPVTPIVGCFKSPLKQHLKGRCFINDDKVKEVVMDWFSQQSSSFIDHIIHSLVSRWDVLPKCSGRLFVVLAYPQVPAVPKKKEKMPKIRSQVELAKCECCGKLGPKSKFKRSKRFCSTSCAKRYTVGCSKRHALSSGQEQPIHEGSVKTKKRKLGFKSKKGWKKSQSRASYVSEWPQDLPSAYDEAKLPVAEVEAEESHAVEMDRTSTAAGLESVVLPVVPPTQREKQDARTDSIDPHAVLLNKSALKWTVTEVVDFVRNLPGCSDYADEFRAQEIDGQAFLLLKEDHLMSTMSMKLGPALKVCARINTLKEEINH